MNFQVVEIIGGGGKTICLPPNIFIGGATAPPRIDASVCQLTVPRRRISWMLNFFNSIDIDKTLDIETERSKLFRTKLKWNLTKLNEMGTKMSGKISVDACMTCWMIKWMSLPELWCQGVCCFSRGQSISWWGQWRGHSVWCHLQHPRPAGRWSLSPPDPGEQRKRQILRILISAYQIISSWPFRIRFFFSNLCSSVIIIWIINFTSI